MNYNIRQRLDKASVRTRRVVRIRPLEPRLPGAVAGDFRRCWTGLLSPSAQKTAEELLKASLTALALGRASPGRGGEAARPGVLTSAPRRERRLGGPEARPRSPARKGAHKEGAEAMAAAKRALASCRTKASPSRRRYRRRADKARINVAAEDH